MTLAEFLSMPEIASYFPLTFEPHFPRVQWNEITVACGECQRDVPPADTRGYVTRFLESGTYRDAPLAGRRHHLVAQALCPCCETLTTADYVLGVSPEGRLTMTGLPYEMVR